MRPKEILYGSSAPLFEGVEAWRRRVSPDLRPAMPRLRWTTGSSRPITLCRCSKIILECFRSKASDWPGKPAAASAAGAILYYIRSTQRGTLDHIDRVGFYERQNCLVLDATTVRNLELIEPLFAGNDAGVTLFRCSTQPSLPWANACSAPGCCAPRSNGRRSMRGSMQSSLKSKQLVGREELRRTLDGILDLERLLSRVTLETANPRDVLALAASLARIPQVAQSACWILRRATRRTARDDSTNSPICAKRSTDRRPRAAAHLSDGGVIASGVDKDLDELRDLSRNSKQYLPRSNCASASAPASARSK